MHPWHREIRAPIAAWLSSLISMRCATLLAACAPARGDNPCWREVGVHFRGIAAQQALLQENWVISAGCVETRPLEMDQPGLFLHLPSGTAASSLFLFYFPAHSLLFHLANHTPLPWFPIPDMMSFARIVESELFMWHSCSQDTAPLCPRRWLLNGLLVHAGLSALPRRSPVVRAALCVTHIPGAAGKGLWYVSDAGFSDYQT